MPSGTPRRAVLTVVLGCAALLAACGGGSGGVFKKQYEYEEELYLALDGTATVNVNASVAALVALRGAALDVNPRARLDRSRVRALFTAPGVEVTRVSLSRRDRRRFVHVSVDVPDVRRLAQVAPFAWSKYRFAREGDVVAYEQQVGAAVNKPVGNVGWTGRELIAFRMHVPSRIPFHNSPNQIRRGNILEWEQPLSDRLRGVPLELQVQMEPQSILYSTLLLFLSTIVAAAVTFGAVVWWVARRGRDAEMAESRP
jgi:hypothetical protein